MSTTQAPAPEPTRDPVTAPLRIPSPEAVMRLGELLKEKGFRKDLVIRIVPEAKQVSGRSLGDYSQFAKRIPPEGPVECLMRAFLLEAPTQETEMRGHIGDETFEMLLDCGLLEAGPDGWTGCVTILPDQQFFLISDHTMAHFRQNHGYYVMGTSSTSMRVAESVAPRKYGKVLDLCCGAGIQSFYLAHRAERIIAADKNPRALNMGRFAALLNGFRNIEFRETDFFSAVADEQFDLMVCNPPFVISPENRSLYRDGGLGGDGVSEKVIRGAAAQISEGGFVHMLCDIASYHNSRGVDRLKSWVEGNGCDVIALMGHEIGPLEYARNWLAPTKGLNHAQYLKDLDAWVEHFQAIRMEHVNSTLVIMRKRSGGKNWVVTDDAPGSQGDWYGAQLRRLFACQDILQQSDEGMLDYRLITAPELRLHNSFRHEDGKWKSESAKIRLESGLMYEFVVDPLLVGFLSRCDGKATLGALIGQMAEAIHQDPRAILPSTMQQLRGLIGRGVLLEQWVLDEEAREAA